MLDEYNRSNIYWQTNFLDEINNNIDPSDELYELFIKVTKHHPRLIEMIDIINENRLYAQT